MRRFAYPSVLVVALMANVAQAADTTPAATVDHSKTFYTRQSKDGSTVLGNGDAEPGATPLRLQAPATVGATNLNPRTAGRPGTEGVTAAMNGVAPTTDYTPNAINPDLKAREEKIATRVSQMYHRNHGLKDAPTAAASGK
jgi:hypothetical protein